MKRNVGSRESLFTMIGTSIHDGQLQRYRKMVENYYCGKRPNLYYAYVKTHNDPKYILDFVRNEGYKTVGRDDILSVFSQYNGNNQLVLDYRQRLLDITNWTNNWKTWPVHKWGWFEWQGFYMYLEELIIGGRWHYVANPSGGFQCFWWHEVWCEDVCVKLQFEQSKLCFKIYYDGDDLFSSVRWHYYQKLMALTCEHYPEVHKPDRFGNGANMTIGFVDSASLFGTGQVDLEAVVCKLHQYEKLVDEMAR